MPVPDHVLQAVDFSGVRINEIVFAKWRADMQGIERATVDELPRRLRKVDTCPRKRINVDVKERWISLSCENCRIGSRVVLENLEFDLRPVADLIKP